MSARQVVRDSKGFKGRVLACQSESSAFFYLPSLPRASGPPDLSKFWTSPRFEEKNSMLGKLCTSAPPNAAAKFGQVPDLRWKRKILCWENRAPVLPQIQQQNLDKSQITKIKGRVLASRQELCLFYLSKIVKNHQKIVKKRTLVPLCTGKKSKNCQKTEKNHQKLPKNCQKVSILRTVDPKNEVWSHCVD